MFGFFRNHQRWAVVGLLFLVALVNNLDRQSLSVLSPTLRERLHYSPVEYSYIVSSFLAAYTLGYVFTGSILDRLGIKLGLGLALAFWSVASMLHATANGWLALAVFRFLLGLGESFNSPAGVKAISEWIPPSERGLSMAVFSNGNVIGAVIAPPLIAYLALTVGWRFAFLVTGAIGLILTLVWLKFYSEPETSTRISPRERAYLAEHMPAYSSLGPRLNMIQLLASPVCIGFVLARFLTDSWSYFLSFWLPEYLTHSRGFTLATIGIVGWIPYLAGDVGGPGGGALSDWFVRRGWRPARARKTMMLVAACLMPAALIAVRAPTAWVALSLIAVLYAAQTCWMANQLTLIAESVSRQNVATMLSLSALGGSLGGIVSNLLVGRAVASVGYVPVFTVFGFLHLTAFGVIVLFIYIAQHRARALPLENGV